MTNLTDLIADLDTLAAAYNRRAEADSDPKGSYNREQGARFALAASFLRDTVAAAANREVAALV